MMKRVMMLLTILLTIAIVANSQAQTLPLVYDVENTGIDCPIPYLPSFGELPIITHLPDPFEWSDGRGCISNYSDWRYRRTEIKAEIENYEIGEKPGRPDSITASYSGSTLTVNVTVNGNTLTLNSAVVLPAGDGPFPAVIGMNGSSGSIPSTIFSSRDIARITFSHNQVTSYGSPSNSDPYYQLYPNLNIDNTGQYSAWAWGVSRIIDGLELVQDVLPIDIKHIAVTGCSYAGKMALFAGAFDERVALTIAQESGGGGATSWRYSQSETNGTVEDLDHTDHNWFRESMFQFGNANVSRLPEDHHELMAMVAPRALLVTANPDYTWLSNPSCYVCSKACEAVYEGLGIPDRFGYSIIGGHLHCAVPGSQIPEVEAFVDKFLLDDTTANTNISTNPYNFNVSSWITWDAPTLSNDSSFFGKASLIYPEDLQTGVDTSVTLKWGKVTDAEKYIIQLSADPTFTNIEKSDSTSDTLKAFTGLLEGKKYYWRVQVKSTEGLLGPWSNIGSFTTAISLPATPQLDDVSPYPNRPGWFIFKWNKVNKADQYLIQVSDEQTINNVIWSSSTPDTTHTFSGFSDGPTYFWRVRASNLAGPGPWSEIKSFTTVTDVEEETRIPTEYSLSQNYPNPFNPTTKIKFALPKTALTKIIIYNLLGREIKTLINKELEAGYHSINIDASDLPSGIYFYKISSGEFVETKKMILLK